MYIFSKVLYFLLVALLVHRSWSAQEIYAELLVTLVDGLIFEINILLVSPINIDHC